MAARGNGKECGRGENGSPPSVSRPGVQTPVQEACADTSLRAPVPKLRQINPEDLGMQFKRSVTVENFPDRPGFGTKGKRIKLISNCFSLQVPSGSVYHYDVTINNIPGKGSGGESSTIILSVEDDKKYRCLSTKRNRGVIKLMLDTYAEFNNVFTVYDGQKNIYTKEPLKGDFPIERKVVLSNEDDYNPENPRNDLYIVKIKPVYKEDGSCAISLDTMHAFYDKKISSVPQETIMALETILRQGPCLQLTPIGRSFYCRPDKFHPLGGGLEIWSGYYQSVRLGQWGPMVNLNYTATSFYQKGPVINFIAEVLGTNISVLCQKPLSNLDIKKLNTQLKHLKVEVTHLKNYQRKYRIVRLTKENANQLEFNLTENGRTVQKTVYNYFRERYGKNLQYPHLPCLQVQPEKKKIYLPIEVCEIIEGQHFRQKLHPSQQTKLIRFTALSPKERFAKIKSIAENPKFNNDSNVQQFGVEVSKDPIECEGQVLDSPTVCYKDGSLKPSDGSWNMKNLKYLTTIEIKSWVLLSFSSIVKPENRPDNALRIFTSKLLSIANEKGLKIGSPKLERYIDFCRCNIKEMFLELKKKYQAQLAIIVLPATDKRIYARIKQAAENVVGLHTQCILDSSILEKINHTVISNICLKINVKTGGENNTLAAQDLSPVFSRPAIIIGADVNHPGTESIQPSLAACVCSLDNRLSRYAVSVKAQTNVDEKKQAVEIILDLKNMVIELLKIFYNHTKGKKPEKIIFYRDGVSEGQFDQIYDEEICMLREACLSFKDYQPGITFIVVKKRHRIRFMPQNPNDGVGTQKNVPPGTIVDTGIADPVKFDFFLYSHHGLKGTSKPSHYTVLHDDNKFSADELQKLTYQLCHTYACCTRSISIPVPIAYAHKAAFRARDHLVAALEEASPDSDSSDGTDTNEPLLETIMKSIEFTGELKKDMYFV